MVGIAVGEHAGEIAARYDGKTVGKNNIIGAVDAEQSDGFGDEFK